MKGDLTCQEITALSLRQTKSVSQLLLDWWTPRYIFLATTGGRRVTFLSQIVDSALRFHPDCSTETGVTVPNR